MEENKNIAQELINFLAEHKILTASLYHDQLTDESIYTNTIKVCNEYDKQMECKNGSIAINLLNQISEHLRSELLFEIITRMSTQYYIDYKDKVDPIQEKCGLEPNVIIDDYFTLHPEHIKIINDEKKSLSLINYKEIGRIIAPFIKEKNFDKVANAIVNFPLLMEFFKKYDINVSEEQAKITIYLTTISFI
jgi:hypothetical protein